MNEVLIDTRSLPGLISGAFEIASSPFIHADRITNFNVLIYVVEGYICVTEDETDYLIKKEELFFLKKNIHHYGKFEIPQGTKWYYIHFYGDEPAFSCIPFSLRNEPGNQGLVPEEHSYFLPLPKQSFIPMTSSFFRNLTALIDYLNSTDPLRRFKQNAKLFELLSECALSSFQNKTKAPALSGRICSYLEDHVQEPFHSDLLEKEFHLSYKHMAALFKKETGSTMQTYHTNLKMNLACKMLRSTLLPIKEISSHLGYQDMLYFSRTFHRLIGLSPSLYRRRNWI